METKLGKDQPAKKQKPKNKKLKKALVSGSCQHDYGIANYDFQTCKKCGYTY